MNIGIVSDSHDHAQALSEVSTALVAQGITTAIHLGDLCAPTMIDTLMAHGLIWHGVFGNNDTNQLELALRKLPQSSHVDILNADFRVLEIGDRLLFITHYPQIARIAAISGKYDAVFHGHTHRATQELIKTADGSRTCPLYNPGELYGTRYGACTYMICNTDDMSVTEHTL
jgi:uncharacterized protein